jgi:hypothetical protein
VIVANCAIDREEASPSLALGGFAFGASFSLTTARAALHG